MVSAGSWMPLTIITFPQGAPWHSNTIYAGFCFVLVSGIEEPFFGADCCISVWTLGPYKTQLPPHSESDCLIQTSVQLYTPHIDSTLLLGAELECQRDPPGLGCSASGHTESYPSLGKSLRAHSPLEIFDPQQDRLCFGTLGKVHSRVTRAVWSAYYW